MRVGFVCYVNCCTFRLWIEIMVGFGVLGLYNGVYSG